MSKLSLTLKDLKRGKKYVSDTGHYVVICENNLPRYGSDRGSRFYATTETTYEEVTHQNDFCYIDSGCKLNGETLYKKVSV